MPIYLEYDGGKVKGDVTESGHKDWIEVNSFQWGVGRGIASPTGGSKDRESSAPSVSEITVSKAQDAATGKIITEAFQGEGVKATIDFCKTDKGKLEVYLQFKLEDVMISGYSVSSGGDRPSESVSLNFSTVEIIPYVADKDGAQKAGDKYKYNIGEATGA
jgi:type VI secretion system secreted protein Hcp